MQTNPPPKSNLPTRLLGKTGVRVPVLGFGTAACGYRRNVSNAVRLYNEALDAGVTYFDTAPNETGYGIAQRQLSPLLRERCAEVFLVTKCHTSDGDAALRQLDRSLREMGTDHADLVHVHSLGDLDPDRVMRNGGILQALERAKRDGLLRFIGLSGHSRPAHFRTVLGSAWVSRIDVIMCAVNFADRHTYDFEGKVLPLAANRNLGIAAMKVFGGADFGSRAMSNAMMSPAHHDAAFRYALSHSGVALAVIGMATAGELRQNVERARRFQALSVAERSALAPHGVALSRRWGAHFGPAA